MLGEIQRYSTSRSNRPSIKCPAPFERKNGTKESKDGQTTDSGKQTLPPGINLVSAPELKEWQMDIAVLDNPLYQGEGCNMALYLGRSWDNE